MNAGCAPKGIGFRHLAHQIPDFAFRSQPTGSLSPGNPGPEKAESSPMPADNSLRSHNKQRLSPIRPDSREPDPKAAVEPSQPGSWALSLHHGQLLPEGQILPSQFSKARRENQKTNDRKQEPEHANDCPACTGGKSIPLRQI